MLGHVLQSELFYAFLWYTKLDRMSPSRSPCNVADTFYPPLWTLQVCSMYYRIYISVCLDLHSCISHRTGVQVSYVLLSIGELLDFRYFHGSLCACKRIKWAHRAHKFTRVLTVCSFHLDRSVHIVGESHFCEERIFGFRSVEKFKY